MNFEPWLQVGLSICTITYAFGQFVESDVVLRCPENWIRRENSCYRFIKSPTRRRTDAQLNCKVNIITVFT